MRKVISAKSKCTSTRARRSNLKWSGSKSQVLAVQHLKQCEQIWTKIFSWIKYETFSQALLSPLWCQLNVLNLDEQMKQESYWCLTRRSNNWTSCDQFSQINFWIRWYLAHQCREKQIQTFLGLCFLRALVSSSIDSVSHWDLQTC